MISSIIYSVNQRQMERSGVNEMKDKERQEYNKLTFFSFGSVRRDTCAFKNEKHSIKYEKKYL